MGSSDERQLPRDPQLEALEKKPPIDSVAAYIERVEAYMKAKGAYGKQICVFRGEPRRYEKPCRPGVFRDDYLLKNPFFEKSLLEAMRQDKLTKPGTYLENAIEAQHGEFPSRLLDVSYNCLTALYFAVTPYYHWREDKYDGVDGGVYVFFVDEIYSPSADNTNKIYEAIITRSEPWISEPLFQKNHKFIDHSKLCPRIIAQQGAFILFQGDSVEDLPCGAYYGIRIPHGAKVKLRRELRTLFGIHTGSIYPEMTNLVQEMKAKSERIQTESFSMESEADVFLRRFRQELEYYLNYMVEVAEEKVQENTERALWRVGKVVEDYSQRIGTFYKKHRGESEYKNVIEQLVAGYNQQIRWFKQDLGRYGIDGLHSQELKISKP